MKSQSTIFWTPFLLGVSLVHATLSLAATIVVDPFSDDPPIATRTLYAPPFNSVSVNSVAHTAAIHRATAAELGIVYSFPASVFVEALTTQTFLQIPIIAAPATDSLLWVNASYEGGGPLGPQFWSGTRSFVFHPSSGDLLSADLTFALNAVNLPPD